MLFPTDVFRVILEYTLDWSITWRRAMAPVLQEMRHKYLRKRYSRGIYSGPASASCLWFRYTRYSFFGGRGLPQIEMELDDCSRSHVIFTSESARRWFNTTGR